MEKAIEDERRATELVEITKQRLEAAADEYLRDLRRPIEAINSVTDQRKTVTDHSPFLPRSRAVIS